MHDKEKSRRFPTGIVASIAVAILAAGGGAAWWAWSTHQTSVTPPESITPSAPTTSQQTPQPQQPLKEETVQIYWLNPTGEEINLAENPVTVAVEPSASQGEILEEAFKRLLVGSSNQAFTTAIPQGTQLHSLRVEPDGVHVDLSEEFTTGGGSASMTGRLGQVLYTATSLDPNAQVWIDVDGKPLDVLGGEGIIVDQPMTRQDFQENFEM